VLFLSISRCLLPLPEKVSLELTGDNLLDLNSHARSDTTCRAENSQLIGACCRNSGFWNNPASFPSVNESEKIPSRNSYPQGTANDPGALAIKSVPIP
jgi:hypothetical protein